MPYYLYESPTGKIIEVFQHMNDVHEYSEGKVKFKRVWTKPSMGIDTIIVDPFSGKDFNRITNKKDTIGSLFDRSKELSQKRVEKEGIDNYKEKFYNDYTRKHKGAQHPEQKREISKKKLDEAGIKVDWSE